MAVRRRGPKYGRGLNREIVAAVNRGEFPQRFSVADVAAFAARNGWNLPENYLRCCLANGASETHSMSYAKYFERVAPGEYQVRAEFLGDRWL